MPGARITQIDRDRLIDAYLEGRDYIELADALSISQRSAYRIIMQFKRTNERTALPTGAPLPKKISQEMRDDLIDFVGDKPTATLDEMKSFLLNKYPGRAFSTTTIRRSLDGALITLKLVRSVPFQWNSSEVKEDRAVYAQWMMSMGVTKNLIYVDDCGSNVWTARNFGRSSRGSRAVRMVDGQRGRNLTLALAVSPQFGLVHHVFVTGGKTKEGYAAFLSEVSSILEDDEITIIQDNAPSHRDCPFLSDIHDVKCLPRYSPFLNITENAISCLKSAVKRQLSSQELQLKFSNRQLATEEGITLQQLRLQILQRCIMSNINEITLSKCHSWFGHTLTYIDRCRERESIFA